jgi:hypothetical protein
MGGGATWVIFVAFDYKSAKKEESNIIQILLRK